MSYFFDLGDENGEADRIELFPQSPDSFVLRALDEDGKSHTIVMNGDQGRKLHTFLTWLHSDENVPCPLAKAA